MARSRTTLSLTDRLPIEVHTRLVAVVAAAAELDVLDTGFATHRVRPDVVELHEGALTAPAAVRPHERAATEVAYPYGPLERRGDVTRTRCSDPTGSGCRFAGRARLLPGPELLPGQIREQGGEGAVENGLVVARG
jgi:hypothetical protein